ncbi:MAG: cupin domain-containing protein [Devosia sp.]|nr:cupin domain-containing protein [Devosia sp.]
MPKAEEIIARLSLERHPEGGWYRQTFADAADASGRPHSTAIHYLLEGHDQSAWHRVDAAEVWHWYAGAPLRLRLSRDGVTVEEIVLGPGLAAGQRPQGIVPTHCWQSAKSLGDWTLVGCTVAPGFLFSGFEMAPKGWEPGVG